jgi:hypothetical protein
MRAIIPANTIRGMKSGRGVFGFATDQLPREIPAILGIGKNGGREFFR